MLRRSSFVFSIRSLLVITVAVAVITVVVVGKLRKPPRPYKSLERITKGRVGVDGWVIEVAPDVAGPFRFFGTQHYGAGESAYGWVEPDGIRRPFSHPGRPGTRYRLLHLMNAKNQRTYLLLSKTDESLIESDQE